MADKKIKGITIEIGGDVTPLSKALGEVNKKSNSLQSELRAVEKLLKLDPSNTELLAQKQKLLADAVSTSKDKLDILKKAQSQVEEQFKNGTMGEAEYREFQRQVIKAEQTLNSAEKANKNFADQLDDTGGEAKHAGDDTEKAGKQAKQSGDNAEKGGSGWEKLGKLASGAAKITVGAVAAIGTGAAVTGKALYNMSTDAAASTDNIDKQSQRLGMSRQAFQEWDYILGQNGVSIDTMNTAMKSMTTSMASLAEEGSKGEETLGKLGVTVDDLNNKSQEEIFEQAVVALQKMPEGYEKARLSQQLFGKQGQEMLPMLNQSKGSIEELKEKAHDLGMVMSDDSVSAGVKFTDSLDTLKRTMGGVKNNIAAEMLPGLSTLTDGFTSLISGQDGAADSIKDGAKSIVKSISGMIPKILSVIKTIVSTIVEIAPDIISALVDAFLELLPQLIDLAIQLMQSVLDAIANNTQMLVDVIMQLLTTIITFIIINLPLFIDAGLKIIIALINGIAQALPTIIQSIVDMIPKLVQAITDNLPFIIQAGITLILALVNGLITAIPQLLEALPTIITALLDGVLSAIPQLIDAGIQLLTSLVAALPEIITTIVEVLPEIIDGIITALLDNLPLIIQAGIDLLVALVEALPKIIIEIVKAIPKIITGIIDALIENLDKIIQAGIDLFIALIENLPKIIIEIVKAIPEIIKAIVEAFGSYYKKMGEIGLNLIKGLWEGIKDAGAWLWDKISGFFGDITDRIKDFFGIHSPSTLMENLIGKNLVKGIGVGFEVETPNLQDTINDNLSGVTAGLQTTLDAESAKINIGGNGTEQTGLGSIILNIDKFINNTDRDIDALTDQIADALENKIQRRREVFA